MPQAVILESSEDLIDCPDSFRPAGWLQPTTSLLFDPAVTSVTLPNREDKFDSTLDYSGNVQHQHASGLLKNNCPYDYAKFLNLALAAVLT